MRSTYGLGEQVIAPSKSTRCEKLEENQEKLVASKASTKEIQRSEKRTRQVVVEKYKLCFDKIMRTLVDSEVVQKSALLMSLMVAQTGLIDELWFQAHKEFQADIDAMDIDRFDSEREIEGFRRFQLQQSSTEIDS
ncbi:hypothetical protein DY000_02055921 [Brassica cretica]|uniref:Uncharacterized protein n=1 Tax=Brassica cretica TaxID=69181 RepID=A0ABQ7A4Z6_BRACR|nr:hypothetical protein DY000_02055921 [Brassica cretica]